MLLDIKHLSAGYGARTVLHNVSLSLEQGTITALIGPNGAGKSTVLKSIMGLTDNIHGDIAFKTENIRALPTHTLLEKGIAFVPQGRIVFPSLTVLENLEMGGYILNHRETLEKNLENVFSIFPVLRKKSHIRATSLSGGEQQMLAIGRALVTSPDLLMLDEPSLGLAPKITQAVFEKLQEVNATGTTLLIVEQNVRLVLQYATRGYLMVAGAIHISGNAEELSNEKLLHGAYLL